MENKITKAEIKTLQIFDLVLRMKSIKGAAEALNISHSTVSKSIKNMRVQHGDPIFFRVNRQLEATVFARNLHKNVQSLLMKNSVQPEASYSLGHEQLVISSAPHISTNIIPLTFHLAKEEQINAVVHVPLPEATENYSAHLLSKSIDVIFDYEPVNHPDILYRKLFKEELCIVCSKNHPRISQSLTQKEYLQESHALIEGKSPVIRNAENRLDSLFLNKNVEFQSSCYIDLLSVVEVSELICVVPTSLFLKFNNAFMIKSPRYNFGLGFKEPMLYMSYRKDFQSDIDKNPIMKLLEKIR